MNQPSALPEVQSVRGFLCRSYDDVERINELYHRVFDSSYDVSAWPYRREVLTCALGLIGNLPRWLEAHEKSPYVYGRRYDFLVDTLDFVKNGKRALPAQSWLELLEDDPAPNRAESRHCELPRPKVFRTEAFLAQWCAQPKGFQDMLCSLNVLYGAPKPHVTPAGPFERLSVRPL